ncbi:right-handed parallel beta-helix repeat-containing protein [uncultured Friedmanniella sp.]|uniref:right-handed parallel beta-helix repeat-containing protein n=1 Tax=uncultured Friedmanniella sp. TaxID=335381 RepID=UPI0035CC4A40
MTASAAHHTLRPLSASRTSLLKAGLTVALAVVATATPLLVDTPASAAGTTQLTGSRSATSSSAKLHVSHGAGQVGSARYAVPGDAVVVSRTGSDTNPGTLAKPFRTLAKAVTRVRAGGTVVLRGGTYHEFVLVPPGHDATIQPYPGEKVWFDGTRAVTGFKRSGSAWVAPWKVRLDSSPTYVKGAPDGKAVGWQFVNPKHPMAAHPDMVWLGGHELAQVRSRSLVKAGTFYVDTAKGQLVLGSNPGSKKVRSSDLPTAFSLRAPGTVLRGFGIRRYADSVWQQGVVTAYYPNMTLDNMTVLDSATGGIGFYKSGSTIRHTTVDGSGQIGIQASFADGLVIDDVSVTDSNDEQFNPGPSAGGIKVTRTRGLTLRDSEILRTQGNQFWADESTSDITVTGNEILNGTRYGVLLEISSTAAVTDNVIAHNAYDGVMVTDTDKVRVWNNTIVANRRAIAFAQDSRRGSQPGTAGHDPRRPQPDPTMPWVLGHSSVSNNVLAAGAHASAVLSVESYQHAFNAGDLVIAVNGNAYAQPKLGGPRATVVWARAGAQPVRYVSLDTFRAATGQERASVHALVSTPVDGAYRVTSAISAQSATVARPLPADLAGLAGHAAGTKRLGAWNRPVA